MKYLKIWMNSVLLLLIFKYHLKTNQSVILNASNHKVEAAHTLLPPNSQMGPL